MLRAPQLITNARMLYLVWIPEDPDAAAALLPEGLRPAVGTPVYINQYVVDDRQQTSGGSDPEGFGAYSLTYLGVDLDGLDTEAGVPARFWTHYWNSSETMIEYARARGIPASSGVTRLDLQGEELVATTFVEGAPAVRTEARVVTGTPVRATGQLRYVTKLAGELRSGRYPFVADLAETFQVHTLSFLDRYSSAYALRPALPIESDFGFYTESISFCYPGGEGPLGSPEGS